MLCAWGVVVVVLNHVYDYFLKTKLLTKSLLTSLFRIYPTMRVDMPRDKDIFIAALFELMESQKYSKCSS